CSSAGFSSRVVCRLATSEAVLALRAEPGLKSSTDCAPARAVGGGPARFPSPPKGAAGRPAATVGGGVRSLFMVVCGGWGARAAAGPAVQSLSVRVRRLRVRVALVWRRHVREVLEHRHVVAVDAVAERHLVPLEEAGDSLLLDVDDVVRQAPAVRE